MAEQVEAMVSGYHVYKRIWDGNAFEELPCKRERGNCHDLFAVAVHYERPNNCWRTCLKIVSSVFAQCFFLLRWVD